MNRRSFLNKVMNRKSIMTDQTVKDAGYNYQPIIRGISEISKILKFTQKYSAYICGGYALYAWNPMFDRDTDPVPGDVDIYTLDDEDFYEMKAEFEKEFASTFVMLRETNHSFTYTNIGNQYSGDNRTDIKEVQLIKPIKTHTKHTVGKDVFEILDHFDFCICQAAIISESQVVVSEQGEVDAHSKTINMATLLNPYITFARCAKYAAKGYKITPQTMNSIFEAYTDRKSREDKIEMTLLQEFNKSGVNS